MSRTTRLILTIESIEAGGSVNAVVDTLNEALRELAAEGLIDDDLDTGWAWQEDAKGES